MVQLGREHRVVNEVDFEGSSLQLAKVKHYPLL